MIYECYKFNDRFMCYLTILFHSQTLFSIDGHWKLIMNCEGRQRFVRGRPWPILLCGVYREDHVKVELGMSGVWVTVLWDVDLYNMVKIVRRFRGLTASVIMCLPEDVSRNPHDVVVLFHSCCEKPCRHFVTCLRVFVSVCSCL